MYSLGAFFMLENSKWKITFKKTAVGEQQDFFGQAARGEHAPLKPLQETYTPQQQSLLNTFNKHKGYFDEHIETSIPNFRKNSLGKMNAIVQSHPQNAKMLDIASSEGSLGKTITEASGGRIQTTNLDPQEQMIKTFNTKSQVPGAESISAAFGTSFEDEKGQTVPKFAPSHSYDVVHESMAFQFFGPEREEHIVEAKRLLAPDGIFLSEEKVRTDNEIENETQKDVWKAQYHTPEALQKKQKQVGFQGENTGSGGMMDKMVHQDILESLLKKYFKYVVQYWSSGNFKGYAASDSKDKIDAYINNYEFEPHDFETEQIPRSIDNPKISKWKIASAIKNLTPEYLNWIKKKVKYEGWMRGADQMYLNMAIPDEYDVSVEKERREQMQDPSFTIRQKEINPENDIKFIGLVGLLHSLAMIPIEQIDLNQLNEKNLEYNPQDIQEIINAYSHGFWKGAINIENKMKQNPFLTRDDLGLEYKNNPHPYPGGEYKISTHGQRALAIGDSAVETTFNAVPEVHNPSEDEEIQIVDGKKKKWKMVRPKDHKGEDSSYVGPENKSGWGFYSKWKLSVPPADQAKEFSEGFEQTNAPKELKHKYPVRGHRWKLDPTNLERLYNHPQWPLETPYYVQALSKEDIGRPRGVNSMDEWSSLMGEHHPPGETKAGIKSGAIFINPLLSPEAANEALWHELQHAYQHQEKRWQEHKNDYVNPLELQNRGLSDEEKKEKTKQYYKHPMELDANEFADYMKKHPLISESEPHYNPNWVPEEQRHAAQELIDQYYAEHGSKHRLRLPSLKNSKWIRKEAPARSKAQFRYMQGICNGSIEPPENMTRAQACEYVKGQHDYKDLPDKKSKWKKISIGLWDPENTDSSHYFETKVVEEIPINVAMQMLDVERGKEDYESSNIENLVKNISQNGFLNPIIIDYNVNDNTAFISEGNHRVQAAKQLGIGWIPARGVRNYGQKSRFKELPVQWQGTQEDHAGDLYIPPHFPPHMIGIPVKEKVKGFEDGENYNGWETKEARQKDKPTPAQKLAKKKELQDKLIDCGFSPKAASLIALQEISQKYSYWVDGYNAAVGMRDPETGQWHMDVGFDSRLTHGAVTAGYIKDLGTPAMRNMIENKESRTDYYNNHTARGLYNPKTKDFIHFSHPDAWDEKEFNFKDLTSSQRKQMEKFWKDLAEQNGIVIDTLRILNNQSGHFEDLDVSDLEMPEEIREQMAKKNLAPKNLEERVDRVRELEAEGLSQSEALNKMTLEEWELKYKKEFERGGKYVYASKWKIVAKGYVTKRSNFTNHRRVGFIPGKMIHHKHYSDLKGHQKAVQHYGPLKTHNVRNFKKESVLNEDQAQELFGQQPYMYHDVAAARTKKGNNSQIPIINSIFKNGILPKEQTGVSEYDDWLTSRPEHVYLGEERFYPKNAVPALRIDMSKVDPSTLAPDEDLFPVYGYNNQHAHRLDFNNIKSPPFEKEHPEGATLGNWAHEHSHLDTPKNVRASKELMGSVSVNGGVPADASHFNPPWLDKVEFDIRENMEDPESDLEDDRHLMDLILSNQERISEDGNSDYLNRMMDLHNELYEEVQRRKQMDKRQSKWKIAKEKVWEIILDGEEGYDIIGTGSFKECQKKTEKWLKNFTNGYVNYKTKDDAYPIPKDAKEQDKIALEELKKAEDSGRWSFYFDYDKPFDLIIQPFEKKKESKWKIAKPNLVPSEGVRSAARRGIKYHAEGKAGDGFEAATLDRAHKIANGEELTPEHVKRMHSFFERHAGGRSQKAKKGEITPWDVAWLAWGGTAGRSWAASKVRELENSEKTSKKKCECWEGYKRVPGTKPCEPGSCEKCDKAHKQSKWKIADHQGWTNYETWNVNAMILNDYELNKHFHNLVVNKASGNQFIADAIGLVIGPHNKQLQEDFSSMSDDEEVEMQKQNQEEDWWRDAEKNHPDDYLAQEAYVRQMKEITMTFMGEPQPTDIADYWIDESKVNWKEIYNYWKSNAEAEGNQIISKWKIC